ncbi:ubiquitin 8 [Tanacetum coccineum]
MPIPMNIYLKLACTREKVSPAVLKLIEMIPSKVQDRRIPRGIQFLLTLQGNQLIENSRTFEEYDICNDETIFIVTTGPVQWGYPQPYLHIPPMRINIMFVFTSENIFVKVEEIDKVKAKIQSKIRVPIDKERVHSCILQMQWIGEIFEGHHILVDSKIRNDDTLYCDFKVKDTSI